MTPLQQACVDRIAECYAVARRTWPHVDFVDPTITFDQRGTFAGKAWYYRNLIRLHPVLLEENGEAFVKDTPGHEAAHLIANRVFGCRGHRGAWKDVMRILGQEPIRCHNFSTTTVRKGRPCIPVVCNRCGERKLVTRKQKREWNFWSRTHFGCSAAGSRGETPEGVWEFPKAARTRTASPTGESKIVLARRVWLPELTREAMIARLQEQCNMTLAGATTYYYKLKGEGR